MTPLVIQAKNAKEALDEASKRLGRPIDQLQASSSEEGQFQVELLTSPLKFNFQISEDKMKAWLVELHPPKGAPYPVHTEWVRALKELHIKGVRFGIDESKLRNAIEECQKSDKALDSVEIASGRPPGSGEDARIKMHFSPEESKNLTSAAMPGDVLITKQLPRAGELGFTVLNEPIEGSPPKDFAIECGEGIEERKGDQNQVEYVASLYGIVSFEAEKLELKTPLVCDQDHLRAWLHLIPASCRQTLLQMSDILRCIELAGITTGVQKVLLERSLQEALRKGQPEWNVLAAEGKPAVAGRAAYLEISDASGKFEAVKQVNEGYLAKNRVFARLVHTRAAEDGLTIFGEVIPQTSPAPFQPKLRGAVEADERYHVTYFKSSSFGYAKVTTDSIELLSLVQVSRDAMSAHFDFYCGALLTGEEVTKDFVRQALESSGVVFGVNARAVEAGLSNAMKAQELPLVKLVATGQEAVDGKDAWLEKLWTEGSSPAFVAPGDTVALVHPATQGQAATNVLGESFEGSAGREMEVDCEGTLQVVRKDDQTQEIRATHFGKMISEAPRHLAVHWDLQITADRMEAWGSLAKKSVFGRPIEIQNLLHALKEKGIRLPCEDSLKEFFREGSLFKESILLAKGVPPQTGSSGRLQFFFTVNGQEPLKMDLEELHQSLFLDRKREGEILVKILSPGPGRPGQDIFGEAVSPPAPSSAPPLQTDSSVTFDSQQQAYLANLAPWGYVSFKDRLLKLVSPLKISEDKMLASLSIFPPSSRGPPPQVWEIAEVLSSFKIKVPVDYSEIEELCERVHRSRKAILNHVVARGKHSTDGDDALIEMMVDAEIKAGRLRRDKSMDFRERDPVVNVQKDQAIMRIRDPKEGYTGVDVLGDEIRTAGGKEVEMTVGENVEKTPEKNSYVLSSKIDGALMLTDRYCNVVEVRVIEGDVDFEVGHVRNLYGGVIVKGSVFQDFQVKARDDVMIEGDVESGWIESKHRVFVRGSVIGQSALIRAHQGIEAEIINDGFLLSKGEIQIHKEVYHGKLYSDRSIRIETGRMVGGILQAHHKIDVFDVGSPDMQVKAYLVAGKSFATGYEVEEILREEGILNSLVAINRQIRALQAEQGMSSKVQERLKGLYADRAKLIQRQNELTAKISFDAEAVIEVRGKVYPGSVIRILDQELFIEEERERVKFRLDSEKKEVRIEPL